MSQPPSPQRPTTIAQMNVRLARFSTEEGVRRGLAFQPRATDVIISPYSKSGTTWLQQIVHGLRTRGSMDFDEITQVVPWIEMAFDIGLDLEKPQVAEPRAFKSHLNWEKVPKGGRYIYAVRNPKDVLVSFYRFFEGWWFEPGTIPITTFARERFMQGTGPGRYWEHVASWWAHRHDPNVLFLCFEEMKANLPQTVRAIAHFMEIELDDALLDIVAQQSSLDFMLAHKRQFDDHLVREARDPVCGLPPGGDSAKVRKGAVDAHRYELPKEVSAELDAIWREEMTPKLGLPSYGALRAELAHKG